MFSSITIGDGGEFGTIALWQQTRRNNIVDNKVNDELNLLSGTYNAGMLLWNWPTNEEFSASVIIQAHPSALHNGDWDSGVCLSGGTQNWKVQRNDINITYRDIVLKKVQVNIEQGNNYFGSIFGTGWDMSSVHHGKLTFDRCMVHTEGTPHTRIYYTSYVPSSSPSAFGTFEANYNNCVLEDTTGPVYPSKSVIEPAYAVSYGDHTYNFKGCTLVNQGFSNAHRITNYAPSASLTVNVSGCIEDTSSVAQPTLVGGHAINLGYYPGGLGFPSSLSATLTDHITNQASGNVYDWATNKNNVSYGVPFTFDGTVTSGEVGFVDNAGASAYRDYRPIADLDNLPVKYMTSGELSYKDITGYKRPGGTDQRDAGAFQSISDKVTVKNIGTSSADFTPDYATLALWDSNYYENANILNGETNVLRLKNGEEHSFGFNLFLDGDADVNQSFIFSGQSPHYGDLDSAAKGGITRSNPNYIFIQSVGFNPYKNSADITYKDIGLDTQSSSSNFKSHGQDYFLKWLGGYRGSDTAKQIAPEFNITYDKCIFNYDVSNPITIARYHVYAALEDSEGNIEERAQLNIKAINSIFKGRGNVSGSPSVHGYLTLGDNQFGTNSQMNVDYRGCTFVNSQVGNGRFGGDQFTMSAIGCLIYINEEAHNSQGSWPGAFVSNNVNNLDKLLLKDCITTQRSDHFVYSRFNRDYFPQSSQEASSVFTNTNMRYEIPFNFDGSVSAGTVSFVSSAIKDYKLVADQDNLAVQYMDVSNTSHYDIAGRRRPGLTDAGAFQSHDDATLSAIIGSGVDGVSADHATVALFYAASGNNIVNGQTFDLVFQNQEHDFIVNIGNNPLLEVDQKWIVRGDVSHGGDWGKGARFIEEGLLTNQRWWDGYLGKQDITFEIKDIVISANGYHVNTGLFNAKRVIEDAAHDCTYTFDRCLIAIARRLGWPYPNLVAYNSGTGEQGLNTINILNTVVSGNTTPGTSNNLISPYFSFGGGHSTAGKGNTEHNFVGSTFYNRTAGYATQQNNDYNISGCIFIMRGDNAERVLVYTADRYNTTAVDNLFSNSQSYEEYSLGTNHTNCTFETDFYFDNQSRNDAVTFIGSALDPDGPLDFRLGGDPRISNNLAAGYIPSQEDFGEPEDVGAFDLNRGLLIAIILDAIPKYTIGYRINRNR